MEMKRAVLTLYAGTLEHQELIVRGEHFGQAIIGKLADRWRHRDGVEGIDLLPEHLSVATEAGEANRCAAPRRGCRPILEERPLQRDPQGPAIRCEADSFKHLI